LQNGADWDGRLFSEVAAAAAAAAAS